MNRNILFARIGWGERYVGEDLTGNFSEPSKTNSWWERFNFAVGPGDRCYGYVPPMGPHSSPPNPAERDDFLVILCSRPSEYEPLKPVGWYEDATFASGHTVRPRHPGLKKSLRPLWNKIKYSFSSDATNAYLIPVENRILFDAVPTVNFTRPYVYARSRGKDRYPALVDIVTNILAMKRYAACPSLCFLRTDYSRPDDVASLVERDLSELITYLYPDTDIDQLDLESENHELLTRDHLSAHVVRLDQLDELDRQIVVQRKPVIVVGTAGSGKSALLASWVTHYKSQFPDDYVVTHYVGATPDSSDWRHLCDRLIRDLARHFDFEPNVVKSDNDLKHGFRDALYKAGRRGRCVIAVDDLSRLNELDRVPDLSWLPPIVPDNIALVVSSDQGPYLNELIARRWPVVTTRALTEEEKREIIARYLALFSKNLAINDIDTVVRAPGTGNPLYLRILLDELRVCGEHDHLWGRISWYLDASDIPSLYERVLTRWEQDYEGEAPGLVRKFMTVFFCERDRGIAENELGTILSWPDSPLPRAVFEPLRLAADAVLSERGGVLFLSNRYIWEAVRRRYLPQESDFAAAFAFMTRYFDGHGKPWDNKTEELFKRINDPSMQGSPMGDRVAHVSLGNTKLTVSDSGPFVARYQAFVAQEAELRREKNQIGLAVNLFGQALFIVVDVPEAAGIQIWPLSLALEKISEAVAVASATRNLLLYGNALGVQGLVYSKLERIDEAMHSYCESESVLRKLGAMEPLRDTLTNIGNLLSVQNRREEAQRYYDEVSTL